MYFDYQKSEFFCKEGYMLTSGYYGTELYLLFPTFGNFTCIMKQVLVCTQI